LTETTTRNTNNCAAIKDLVGRTRRRKGTLIPIDAEAEKKYFCTFCPRRAEWTALFDVDNEAKMIERYCSTCADIHGAASVLFSTNFSQPFSNCLIRLLLALPLHILLINTRSLTS
jgi:hypothetical protein